MTLSSKWVPLSDPLSQRGQCHKRPVFPSRVRFPAPSGAQCFCFYFQGGRAVFPTRGQLPDCLSHLSCRDPGQARVTGQRALDVDDGRRQRVLAVLRGLSVPAAWPRMVEEVVELESEEESQLFGEALPIGLRLLNPQA